MDEQVKMSLVFIGWTLGWFVFGHELGRVRKKEAPQESVLKRQNNLMMYALQQIATKGVFAGFGNAARDYANDVLKRVKDMGAEQ